ncbi:hypothetical protein U0070_014759 [Myodes glareolus]|uniref:Uncharacterized protein n=1 Tax=Myodes glareolus TaxID=447135 RepID=A0AAW0H2A8_MYOGA
MWLYLVALVGLWTLLRLFREKHVTSMSSSRAVTRALGTCWPDSWTRDMRVLASCLMKKGVKELRRKTSDRLVKVILDVTKTESIVAATQTVMEYVGNRGLWGQVNNPGISIPSGPNE